MPGSPEPGSDFVVWQRRDSRRDEGLYERVMFPRRERIEQVSLVARARSPQAEVGVRIGR